MADSVEKDFQTVLEFWFGELDARGIADEAHTEAWFKKDPEFDARIRGRFLGLYEETARGERDAWLEKPRSRLASIILIDQFSRNMFRDTARMFESDPKACAAATSGIDAGLDRALALDERMFFYMPLMHSEVLAMQERSVELFVAWSAELTGAQYERGQDTIGYARRHLDIIRRFGRFPHRNQLLGRESSGEELEFLTRPGSSF